MLENCYEGTKISHSSKDLDLRTDGGSSRVNKEQEPGSVVGSVSPIKIRSYS